MEFSIISSSLKSTEIKPDGDLATYIQLLKNDIPKFFPEKDLKLSSCAACESTESADDFQKMGFTFKICKNCLTVYVSSRPGQTQLNHFYQEAASRRYWLDSIWKKSEESRIKKIIMPAIDWIGSFTKSTSAPIKIAELYANNPGFYQIASNEFKNLYSVEPQYVEKNKSIPAERQLLLATEMKFQALCLFDSLDRAESAKDTLQWVFKHLEPGGHCFITGVLSTGLDSLVLGSASDSLIPPDRLTSFSLEGISSLATKIGFKIVELSTPGVLDLENIRKALNKKQGEQSRLFHYLLEVRNNESMLEDLQTFLQANQLSSRSRIVLQKEE